MKMQLLLSSTLAALVAAPSYSQSAGNSEKGKFTFTPAIVSDYIWRGQSQGGMSFQPAITYDKGSWSFGLSLAYPLDDNFNCYNPYPEFDLSASYELSFADDAFKIKPGILAYTYPRAEGQYKAIIEPTVTFELDAKDFNMSFTAYYDVIQKGPAFELAAGYSISLVDKIGLDLSALIGKYELSNTDPESPPNPKADSSGNYWMAGVSIPIAISEKMSLVPNCTYHRGFDRKAFDNDLLKKQSYADEGFWVFGLSYSVSF